MVVMFMVMMVLMSLRNRLKAPKNDRLSSLQLLTLTGSKRRGGLTGSGADAFAGAVLMRLLLLWWVAPGYRVMSMEFAGFGCSSASTNRLAAAPEQPEERNRPPGRFHRTADLNMRATLKAMGWDVLMLIFCRWFWSYERRNNCKKAYNLQSFTRDEETKNIKLPASNREV